jgi:hypothetical protein
MYNLNDIELSRQRREDVARQVENNRLWPGSFGQRAPGWLLEPGGCC